MLLENRFFLGILIGVNFLFYLLYLNFIFTSYTFFCVIMFISIIFYFIFLYLNKKLKWSVEINIFNSIIIVYSFCILFSTISMSYNFLCKDKVENKEYSVPIKGYYTRKVDGVLFSFQGKTFDRPFNLVSKVPEEESKKKGFYKKYRLKISVKEFNFEMYYINSIELLDKVSN